MQPGTYQLSITATLSEHTAAGMRQEAQRHIDRLPNIAGERVVPSVEMMMEYMFQREIVSNVEETLKNGLAQYIRGHLEAPVRLDNGARRITADNSPIQVSVYLGTSFGETPLEAPQLKRTPAGEAHMRECAECSPTHHAALAFLFALAGGSPEAVRAAAAGMSNPAADAADAIQPKSDPADDDGEKGENERDPEVEARQERAFISADTEQLRQLDGE